MRRKSLPRETLASQLLPYWEAAVSCRRCIQPVDRSIPYRSVRAWLSVCLVHVNSVLMITSSAFLFARGPICVTFLNSVNTLFACVASARISGNSSISKIYLVSGALV